MYPSPVATFLKDRQPDWTDNGCNRTAVAGPSKFGSVRLPVASFDLEVKDRWLTGCNRSFTELVGEASGVDAHMSFRMSFQSQNTPPMSASSSAEYFCYFYTQNAPPMTALRSAEYFAIFIPKCSADDSAKIGGVFFYFYHANMPPMMALRSAEYL